MYLISMKINGNKNSSVVTILLLLVPLLLLSTVAKSDKLGKWDKDFFSTDCPGTVFKKSIVVDNNSVTNITADDYVREPDSGTVSFTGNVELKQGFKNITALIGQLNEKKNYFSAQGGVHYEDQHIRLVSEEIDLDMSKQGGTVNNVKFQLTNGNLRGEAESISFTNEQPLNITEVGFTSCPPGSESWLVQSSNVEIDPVSGWGDADNIILWIGKIPVFYLPTISFPIDDRRKSGFLYPSVGNSTRNGFELEAPWYWNIAPDKDATFELRYLSKRGLMLGGEYRQLTKNTYTELFTEFLHNDDRGLPGQEDRYFYKLNSDYASGEHWRGKLAFASLSDDDYFYDFGSNFHSGNRNILRRFGQIDYDDEHLSFRGLFSDDRLLSTSTKSYSRLPQLRLSLLYPDTIDGLESNVHMEATAFRHDNDIEAERLTMVPELSYPLNWLSGYITPTFKLHYSHYSQDDPTNILPRNVSRTVPIFSIDSGIFFERNIDFNNRSFLQTLEPRLFYLYVPQREQSTISLFDTTSVNSGMDSLFRENRYSGSDRIGDSNQLSLAISSRLLDQVNGNEQLRFTLGRAYYLDDREVNLAIYQGSGEIVDLGVDRRANSALITNLQLGLYENWVLEGELEYDESKNRTEKGVIGLQYHSPGLILNMRHRFNRYDTSEDIEQGELSFVWPATDKLSFVGRWQQDTKNNRTIDSFIGLEYESCCWAMRLVARKYLNIRLDQQGVPLPSFGKYNDGIYLEFILKGLTNVGKRLDLESDIQGYEDRFSQ